MHVLGLCYLVLVLIFNVTSPCISYWFVVDDAIVVIETYNAMEEGMPTLEAAKLGAATIVGSIIAMTITLAAVFAPLGFSSGITGALFTEFAFGISVFSDCFW